MSLSNSPSFEDAAVLNGTIEIAGPERFRFDEFVPLALSARNDTREVVADPRARLRFVLFERAGAVSNHRNDAIRNGVAGPGVVIGPGESLKRPFG